MQSLVRLSIVTRLTSALLLIDNGKKIKGELVNGERRRPLPGVDAGPRSTDQSPVNGTFEVPGVGTENGLLDVVRQTLLTEGVAAGEESRGGVPTQTYATDQVVVLYILYNPLLGHPKTKQALVSYNYNGVCIDEFVTFLML